MELILIASAGENRELGKGGDLCWHIKEDLKHFKDKTMGRSLIMGRKTWDSLPKKPLPGRKNIVISSNEAFIPEGGLKACSLEEALGLAGEGDVFVIGGESVYRQSLPFATKLELTRILSTDPDADTFFPDFESEGGWKLERKSEAMRSAEGLPYRFETWVKS